MQSPSRATSKAKKYRAACDRCNQAKVRCSQTRPACARCMKSNAACVYGISQRAGKPSTRMYKILNRDTSTIDRSLTPRDHPDAELSRPHGNSLGEDEHLSLRRSSEFLPLPHHKSPDFERWDFKNPTMTRAESTAYGVLRTDFDHLVTRPGDICDWSDVTHGYPPFSHQIIDNASIFSDAGLNRLNHEHYCGFEGSYSPSRLDTSQVFEHSFRESLDSLAQLSTTTSGQENLLESPVKTFNRCCCIETVIMQLASLRVLLHSKRYAFEVELLQISKAIDMCNSVLLCRESCKESYIFAITMSTLVFQIISALERTSDFLNLESPGISGETFSLSRSLPQKMRVFSSDIPRVDEEVQSRLNQEAWCTQAKKIRVIVAQFGYFRGSFNQQGGTDTPKQGKLLENLVEALEEKSLSAFGPCT